VRKVDTAGKDGNMRTMHDRSQLITRHDCTRLVSGSSGAAPGIFV